MKKKQILPILLIVVIALGIGLTFWIVRREETTDIRDEAAGDDGLAPFITLEPYDSSKGKCLNLSYTDTLPGGQIGGGYLYVKMGSQEKSISQPSFTAWHVCFDNSTSGDVYVRGTFGGVEKTFGPYKNSWGTGSASLTTQDGGVWTVSNSGKMVGIIENPMQGTIPSGLPPFIISSYTEAISITSIEYNSVRITNVHGSNQSYYFNDNPFKGSSYTELTYNNGFDIDIDSLDGNFLVSNRPDTIVYPDLLVSSIKITPSSPYTEDKISIEGTIKNTGNANTKDFKIYLWVDPSPKPPSSPGSSLYTTNATWNTDVPAGTSFKWSATGLKLPYGNHKVYFWVDKKNQVLESDESNNIKNKAFFVDELAPIAPSSCTKTCEEKEILTEDCTCQSVECTKDSHCTGLETCNISTHKCVCNVNCGANMKINSKCTECICSEECESNEKQRSDCSCVEKDEELITDPEKVEITIYSVQDNEEFMPGEKVILTYSIAEGYDVESDKVTWYVNGDEVGTGTGIAIDLEEGENTITLKYEDIVKDEITVRVGSEDIAEAEDGEPEEGEPEEEEDDKKVIIIGVCAASSILFAVIVVVVIKRRKKKTPTEDSILSTQQPAALGTQSQQTTPTQQAVQNQSEESDPYQSTPPSQMN